MEMDPRSLLACASVEDDDSVGLGRFTRWWLTNWSDRVNRRDMRSRSNTRGSPQVHLLVIEEDMSTKRLSRWSSEAAQLFGIDVVYRGSEFTVDAAATFHPHANIIYAPRKPLSKGQWSAFLTWSHRRLGAHWKDCGRLAKPDEAIKYPFKPTDLRGLSAPALGWLYRELERLKLAQPMGSFAAFWRQLEQHGEKIAFVADRRGGKLQRITKRRRDPTTATEANREAEQVQVISEDGWVRALADAGR